MSLVTTHCAYCGKRLTADGVSISVRGLSACSKPCAQLLEAERVTSAGARDLAGLEGCTTCGDPTCYFAAEGD